MLASLVVPIVVSSVALFFASFLSWMVLQLHRNDWVKLAREDDFLKAAQQGAIPPGNYVFPFAASPDERKGDEFKRNWEAGPRGVMTVFGNVSMGRNLALTFLYFLVVSFCLAYLATLALERGVGFMPVFRFVSTAALLTFLSSMVQHAIWFHCRIVGHVIEAIAYAAITGAIFAAMWPG